MHKTPVTGRPMCNMSGTFVEPFGKFLVEKLGPLLENFRTVLNSTDILLECLRNLRLDENRKMHTYDAKNLHPPVEQSHVLEHVSPIIRSSFAEGLATFIMNVVEVVSKSCLVQFGGDVRSSDDGIPTGFAPGVILANLYLVAVDYHLERSLEADLKFYKRFVDDILAILTGGPEMLGAAINSWRGSVQTELTGTGQQVVLLDTVLSRDADNAVKWEMYSKPQKLYLYVIPCSCHRPSAFDSEVTGCIRRAFARNKYKSDALRHARTLIQKLTERGYTASLCFSLLNAFRGCRRRVRQSMRTNHVRKFYMKVPVCSQVRAAD
ncbi:unnamed protein product [Prorocentrum cordatum]|uniref:Reverse transcriptase domain-containing protein n=1 Tax=Prorocentrum cordatum TaxID=2364126 RepID=A0ABN9PDJ4_9DINO|nr:unnamed protein product [Polarella glacialis]